jgi:hypothetical protein
MNNTLGEQPSLTEGEQILAEALQGGNETLRDIVYATRHFVAPVIIISALTSPAMAQTKTSGPAQAQVQPQPQSQPQVSGAVDATPNSSSDDFKISGTASASAQIFSSSWRKASNFRLQLNGPKWGPITSSVSALTTGYIYALGLGAGASLPVASRGEGKPAYFAINPAIGAGIEAEFFGINDEETSQMVIIPSVSASLSTPVIATLDSGSSTYFTFSPSVNFVRYIRSNDVELKIIADSDGDGEPDYKIPKQQLYFGVTTGVVYDKNFLSTSVYYDPFDPSVKDAHGRAVFAYLNIGRNF